MGAGLVAGRTLRILNKSKVGRRVHGLTLAVGFANWKARRIEVLVGPVAFSALFIDDTAKVLRALKLIVLEI